MRYGRMILPLLICAALASAAGAEPDPAPAGSFTAGVQAWGAKKYDEAQSIFQESAEKGSPQAMSALGYMYTYGGKEQGKDLKKGLYWYRRAAAAGEPWAMFALGDLLKTNPDLELHKGEGREMLLKAVEKKLPLACREYYLGLHADKSGEGAKKAAQFLNGCAAEEQLWAVTMLGLNYCSGDGVPKDPDKGLDMLRKAAGKGNIFACYYAAEEEKRRGRLGEAKKLYSQAANKGHAPSMFELGRIAVTEKRGLDAVVELTRAAQNGYAAACMLLGRLHEQGSVVKRDPVKAISYYRQGDDAGDPSCKNELGRLLEQGIGVKPSPEEAFKAYSRGAEAGSAEALYNMARMEYFGIGTAENRQKGLEDFRRCAGLGEPEALSALAAIALKEGTPEKAEEARKLYQEAAEKGSPSAQFALAESLREEALRKKEKPLMEQAMRLYEKAADQGDAAAQFALAQCHADDSWHNPDLVKALRWYTSASEKDFPAALCAMAMLQLDTGDSEEQNSDALKKLTRASEMGYPTADFLLGWYEEHGRMGKRDVKSAVNHYRRAAQNGNVFAQTRLARIISRGDYGYTADSGEAFRWYLEAARRGDASAQCNTASFYASGRGVVQDMREAFRWYQKAAENGSAQAQYNLARMYQYGSGTEKDPEKGLFWMKRAAGLDYAPAQNALGLAYAKGEHVPRSYVSAKQWLSSAAEKGYVQAMLNLGLLYTYSPEGDPADAAECFESAVEQGSSAAAFYLGCAYESGSGVSKSAERARSYYEQAQAGGSKAASEALARLNRQTAK